MRNKFNNVTDVITSPWLDRVYNKSATPELQDRVIQSTKLEDIIYRDMYRESTEMQNTVSNGKDILSTFDSLCNDVFTSFYSYGAKPVAEEKLSNIARQFNKPILEKTFSEHDFPIIKSICEGKDLPAFEAGMEFSERIREDLPDYMDSINGLNTIEKLKEQAENLTQKVHAQYDKYTVTPNESLGKKLTDTANKLVSKEKQIEDLSKKVEHSLICSSPAMDRTVADALAAATQKAMEADTIIKSWGSGESTKASIDSDRELIKKIRANPKLRDISRILGKYINIIADKKKNSFTYGLGEKYDISRGNSINNCLSSELALLGTAETQELFVRKYINKTLKQYRKRERSVKGCGDMVICIDESYSMEGDKIAWAKAFMLALFDICTANKRKCAVIRFSTETVVKVFSPGDFSCEDKMEVAESFLGGGTDFENPLAEACRIIDSGFESADVIFITDGECSISPEFRERFVESKAASRFTVLGLLLDIEDASAGESLVPFCEKIYRASEFSLDDIAIRIISDKV